MNHEHYLGLRLCADLRARIRLAQQPAESLSATIRRLIAVGLRAEAERQPTQ